MTFTLEQRRKWTAKSMHKKRAHWRVLYALRTGKLVKAPCEKCGETKTQAHHEDYSRPLAVNWLCRPCHIALHKERGDLGERSKQFCHRGHPLSGDNLYTDAKRTRHCKTCGREAAKRYRAKRDAH